MAKENRKENYVPLDWEPLAANLANFQIPSREKKILKITNPSGSRSSALHQHPTGSPYSVTFSNEGRGEEANVSPHVINATKQSNFTSEQGGTTSNGSRARPVSIPPQEPSPNGPESGRRTSFIKQTPPEFQNATKEALPALKTTTLASRGNSQQWRPDVYVQAFIPQSLRAINDAPASLVTTRPIDGIDFGKYVSTFAGTHFLPTLDKPPHPSFDGNLPVDSLDRLLPENYEQYFRDCLILDHEAQIPECRSYDLFRVSLELRDHAQQTYLLRVPGVREGTPSVDFGDSVMLRQLILDPVTKLPRGMDLWLTPGVGRDRGAPCPGFAGVQIQATVVGIHKAKEELTLKINGLVLPGTPVCNVSFVVQASFVQSMQRAVADVQQELGRGTGSAKPSKTSKDTATEHITDYRLINKDKMTEAGNSNDAAGSRPADFQPQPSLSVTVDPSPSTETSQENPTSSECPSTGSWLRAMLFPSKSNGIQQKALPSVRFPQTWFDTSLNYEQKKAVDAVQSRHYGTFGYLINGPPGTGKTKTICEMVTQLGNDSALAGSILLCAPSNPAADTLTLRLKAYFGPKRMLRLNAFSRTFAEVPQELLPFCFVENDIFSIPPLPKLMAYKVVVTTCRDADILVQARVTSRDLVSVQESLFVAVHPDRSSVFSTEAPLHWTALIIDEAAQATEPETLIPLTVVTPHTAHVCTPSPIFVMAGDQHQLNARTYHKFTTLHVSLFERLSNHPIYASHPLARKSLHRALQSSPGLRPPFVNLFRNYRSHSAILAIPSSLFYANTLIQEATHIDTLKSWSGWRGRRWPVLFACNGGVDDCEDIRTVGGGWYNRREAQKAIAYVLSLIAEEIIVEQSEICIMSPFRAQVNLLRKMARESRLWGVNIGPMEAFQGLENRFVIICTTRSRKRFLEEDKMRGMGVVDEKKKFNVAITRAKEGLIILGNPWVLATDPCWLAFMNFCRRNSLWSEESEKEDERMQGLEEASVNEWRPPQGSGNGDSHDEAQISGLEAGLIYKERNKQAGSRAARRFMSGSESQEDTLWRTGLAAEEALGPMEP